MFMADSLHSIRPDHAVLLQENEPSCVPPGDQLPIGATVMLVEDDELVRECLRELLDDVGGQVIAVANAAGALERIAADGVPDVLVADLQLGPGMSGLALIAAARLQWPGVRAVLISGTDTPEPPLDPGDRFLRKPFDIGILACTIADLVAGQARTSANHAMPDDAATPLPLASMCA